MNVDLCEHNLPSRCCEICMDGVSQRNKETDDVMTKQHEAMILAEAYGAYRVAADRLGNKHGDVDAANHYWERLNAEINRLHKISELYQELLYAVESKYPGESRHDTALRYIRDRECHKIGALGATAKVAT